MEQSKLEKIAYEGLNVVNISNHSYSKEKVNQEIRDMYYGTGRFNGDYSEERILKKITEKYGECSINKRKIASLLRGNLQENKGLIEEKKEEILEVYQNLESENSKKRRRYRLKKEEIRKKTIQYFRKKTGTNITLDSLKSIINEEKGIRYKDHEEEMRRYFSKEIIAIQEQTKNYPETIRKFRKTTGYELREKEIKRIIKNPETRDEETVLRESPYFEALRKLKLSDLWQMHQSKKTSEEIAQIIGIDDSLHIKEIVDYLERHPEDQPKILEQTQIKPTIKIKYLKKSHSELHSRKNYSDLDIINISLKESSPRITITSHPTIDPLEIFSRVENKNTKLLEKVIGIVASIPLLSTATSYFFRR